MLSSQMSSLSNCSISPLLQSTMSSSTHILRSAGSLPRRARPHHQIRTMRLGVWSSYLEPELQREFHRRHRALRHKYISADIRKLAWDRQTKSPIRSVGLKGFMCSAWRGQDLKPRRRWSADDAITLSGKEAREVGSSAVNKTEHVAAGSHFKDGFYDLLRARTHIFGKLNTSAPVLLHRSLKNAVSHKMFKDEVPPTTHIHETIPCSQDHTTEPEYIIDPITNRKVAQKASSGDKSDSVDPVLINLSTQHPLHNRFDDPSYTLSRVKSGLEEYDAMVSYGPIAPQRELRRDDPVQEGLRSYDERVCYGTADHGRYREERVASGLENGLEDYDRSTSYEPGEFNGKDLPEQSPAVKDGLEDYDRSTSYEPGAFNGDGFPDQTSSVDDGLKEYDESTSYEPGAFNGDTPGEQPVKEDDVWKEYDKTHSYEPGAFNGTKPGEQKETLIRDEDGWKEYDDAHSYEPGAFNGTQPGERAPGPENSSLREYDEIASYEPGAFNGTLSSISPSKEVDGWKEYDDTHSYEPGEFNGILPQEQGIKDESGWKEYDDSHSYEPGAFNGRLPNDSTQTSSPKNGLEDYDSEISYDPGPFNAARQTKSETQGQKDSRRQELEQDFSTPQNDEPINATEIRSRFAANSDITEGQTKETMKRFTGTFARDFSEEFKTQWGYKGDPASTLSQTGQANSKSLSSNSDFQSAEKDFIDGRALTSSFSRRPEITRLQTSLERESARRQETGLNSDAGISEGLEIHFEEDITDNEPAVKVAENENKLTGDKQLVQEIKGIYEETYGTLSQAIRDHYEKKHGIIPSRHLQAPETSHSSSTSEVSAKTESSHFASHQSEVQESTLYKILAYDPAMQSISIAETTSIVPDSATALTPAEVLLRLSNPTKFFPHFKPLQAQGYEIVSGSGDVLVFRKVREAGPAGIHAEPEKAISYLERRRTTINPIDGMRPIAATGNFASPTGFVNYDRLDEEEPPFKSNIDVRREEPVFSGRPNWKDYSWEEAEHRKKPGLAKRVLVGGLMVGSASYAIGVVSDYFQNGGTNGNRIQGF
ncbi:hypothetical protein B0O99DRAFT_223183 [Bisporella sp. PMI_857]|nr:hypothetical protein B0O99DRAFT_223183 [Bisporella sp. PMI_857]